MTETAPTIPGLSRSEHDHRHALELDRVAYFEKAGWEAYYDRKWLRVLRLMVQLNRE